MSRGLGDVYKRQEMQTAIVKATLEQLIEIETPGKIVPLPFEYVAKV